jgi:FAD/FMN-containing dehydrogenase
MSETLNSFINAHRVSGRPPAGTSTAELPRLEDAIGGQIVVPGDTGYEQARGIFWGGFDQRPAAIVRPANAAGVAKVVRLAAETGIELAVRGGGHSTAGHSLSDGGVVLDLSGLTALDIDHHDRTAWAQAGLTTGAYSVAVGRYGLATGFGDTASVGIGGLTLGGGIGYLVRKHGLTIDNLLAAELVTADSRILHVDAETYPDLFWAIRGGGGNFGVVTRFRFQLHELPSIVGGMLILPATAQVIAGFIAAAETAPEELSTIASIMPAPPMPFVPAELVGQPVILAKLCYAGPAETAERVLAPFRNLTEPSVDMMRPMPYADMFPPEEERHPTVVSHSLFLDTVDSDVSGTILEHLQASDAPFRAVELRVLGGAMAQVPVDATAFAHRQRPILANIAAFYGDPADRDRHRAWVDGLGGALRQGDEHAYVNFLGDEGPARVRQAYPGRTWDRLVEIKRDWDPTNLFRRNQNIPPA